jgi:hypothetical protein
MLLFNALSTSAVSGAVISFSVAEPEVVQIMASGVSMAGSYASWYVFYSTRPSACRVSWLTPSPPVRSVGITSRARRALPTTPS